MLLAYPSGLAVTVRDSGWTGARSVAYLTVGAIGFLLVLGVIWSDLRRDRAPSDALRGALLGVVVVAIVGSYVALDGLGGLVVLGLALGSFMAFGVSGLLNLYKAPDPREGRSPQDPVPR